MAPMPSESINFVGILLVIRCFEWKKYNRFIVIWSTSTIFTILYSIFTYFFAITGAVAVRMLTDRWEKLAQLGIVPTIVIQIVQIAVLLTKGLVLHTSKLTRIFMRIYSSTIFPANFNDIKRLQGRPCTLALISSLSLSFALCLSLSVSLFLFLFVIPKNVRLFEKSSNAHFFWWIHRPYTCFCDFLEIEESIERFHCNICRDCDSNTGKVKRFGQIKRDIFATSQHILLSPNFLKSLGQVLVILYGMVEEIYPFSRTL